MKALIAVLAGDGIGPEVTAQAVRALEAIGEKFAHQFQFTSALIGGADPNATVRPEQGLLQLRKALGLFANLRPVTPHPATLDASPIKPELLRGVDIMVVRELTGGIYFGEKTRTDTEATDQCRYSVTEIERVVRLAAD